MFDFSPPVLPTARPAAFASAFPNAVPDSSLPFALTIPAQDPAAVMSGEARPVVHDRFATLADAMHGAIAYAEQIGPEETPSLLAILDRDERLVLAGAASDGAIVWCHPVSSAAEARTVVTEASQLRAQASRAVDWQEPDLARGLRHHANLLEARLVDPLWRAFAARALQVAA